MKNSVCRHVISGFHTDTELKQFERKLFRIELTRKYTGNVLNQIQIDSKTHV